MTATPDLSDRIRAAVITYLDRIGTASSSQIAELYAIDATLEDPAGSPTRTGRAEITDFYRGLDNVDAHAELLTLRISGTTAAFHFRVTTNLPQATVVVEPIDVMTFDQTGHITSLRAIWSPADMTMTPS